MITKKIYFILWMVLAITLPAFCMAVEDKRSHEVLVSIAPYQFAVKAIGGATVTVDLLVPPGASFHTFEPTPKQILKSSHADIWFRIGELFENRAIQAMRSHHPSMRIVDLREGVDLIVFDSNHHCHCCPNEGADLHIWLSPKMMKVQAKQIANALTEVYPEHRQQYAERLEKFTAQLDAVDQEIRDILKPLKARTILVSHPSYGYFARDYGLEQMSIEFEGKDPSPRQLTELLNQARASHIKTIYIQNQYSSRGANLIAGELGANVVALDPYSGDYFATLREIALRIAEQEKKAP
ncbi:MAG: zinc ABC transporter substrate-binding protein [Parachlamydiaceae bacterium]|nr:zinc ABC transporter substrate-binding protein [Parachlamydiaceae bacterium]